MLRPCLPKDSDTLIVQLDDLRAATVNPIKSFVSCVTETSTAKYQAFVAISDGAYYEAREIRRRLISGTQADTGATGAFRVAVSFNAKAKHRLSSKAVASAAGLCAACRATLRHSRTPRLRTTASWMAVALRLICFSPGRACSTGGRRSSVRRSLTFCSDTTRKRGSIASILLS